MPRSEMRKGAAISIPVIIGLLLVVIVVIILSGGVNFAKGLVDYADSIIRGGQRESSNVAMFLDAIKCSYYRCTKGCAYAASQMDTDFDCAAYCQDAWTDADGKICNENAMTRPVEIRLDEPVTLAASDLNYMKTVTDDACIVSATVFQPTTAVGMSWENVQSSMIADLGPPKECRSGRSFKTLACSPGTRETDCGLDGATIKSSKGRYYYLWYNNQYGSNTGGYLWADPTDMNMSCSMLDSSRYPCMRLRPADAAVTSAGSTYTVSFYLQGETNVGTATKTLDGRLEDGPIVFTAAMGISWNNVQQVGFQKKDLVKIEVQSVPHGCNSADPSACTSRIVGSTGAGTVTSRVIYYDSVAKALQWSAAQPSGSNSWGVEAICPAPASGVATCNFKISDLATSDLRVVYTFNKNSVVNPQTGRPVSDPSNWYSPTNTVALFVAGGQGSGANFHWGSYPSGLKNENAQFSEKTQAVQMVDQAKTCTAGSSASDALWAFVNPQRPIPTTLNGLSYNTCGLGCPGGLCGFNNPLFIAGSIGWSGAVSIKFPPKTFVCCMQTSGSASWQAGSTCTAGSVKTTEDNCNPPCADVLDPYSGIIVKRGQCSVAGYGSAGYRSCRDPSDPCSTDMNTDTCEAECYLCSCSSQ